MAGGTGTVGTHVVAAARGRGHDVMVLTRSQGIDLRPGSGLADALVAVDAVIDTSNVSTTSAAASAGYFGAATRALLAAESAAGVRHHVALSIVGVDAAPVGYYAGKVAQEQLVAAGAVPWSILRATQFHEFARQIYDSAKIGPLHLAPRMRTRPVAAAEVGARLIAVVEAGPGGRVTDVAGPREESLVEMIRAYARARGSRAWIPAVSLPGGFGRAQRDGSLLPGAGADLGAQTFAEWVATQPQA